MIGVTVTTIDNTAKVQTATERARFKNFSHAIARIRKDAVGSIEVSPEPSEPGTPPHTRRRQLKRAIRFANDKQAQEAIAGPLESMVGTSGEAHEKGGEFRGQQFEPRPFMVPALEKNLDRFAGDWAGSIG